MRSGQWPLTMRDGLGVVSLRHWVPLGSLRGDKRFLSANCGSVFLRTKNRAAAVRGPVGLCCLGGFFCGCRFLQQGLGGGVFLRVGG